ncbi:hypothetical protein ACFC96_41050 [Streptomyces sp. NPDC055955]|uniref:hypothetical protein n=1 Tax=Streptomyces sp. NPDC055955 TaxID=3345665 RepID=UPI0035D74911
MRSEPNEDDIRRALECAKRTPRPEPAYSDDLIEADVTPLKDFLRARLGELKARLPEASEEHFAVHALTNTMLSTSLRLTEQISAWQLAVADGRSEEPGPVQTLRHNLSQDFNQLVWIARRWREHPDHAPHWRPRHYLNPTHRSSLEEPQAGDASAEAVRGPYEQEAHP